MISAEEREILRDLARCQLEAAHSEKNLARVALWKRHNSGQGERPIIHLEMDTFEQIIFPLPGRLGFCPSGTGSPRPAPQIIQWGSSSLM